jgi:hypothetical protein
MISGVEWNPRKKRTFGIKKPKGERSSAFIITINTNERGYDMRRLKNAITAYSKNLAEGKFIKYIDPEGKWEKVKSVKFLDYAVEAGEEKGFVHGHFVVKIIHSTILQINFASSKDFFREALGLSNFHFNGTYVNDELESALRYIRRHKRE